MLFFHGKTVVPKDPNFWVYILQIMDKVLSDHMLALMFIVRPPKAAIRCIVMWKGERGTGNPELDCGKCNVVLVFQVG